MLFSVRLFYTDYNGEEASTGSTIESVNSLAEVDAFVLYLASVVSGMSDAYVGKAEARTKFRPTTPQTPRGTASCYDRLIVLCTNGQTYGSFTIPAPSDLPYLQAGPYQGYKVDKNAAQGLQALESLVQFLSGTTLPYGPNFPTLQWEAALMRQP